METHDSYRDGKTWKTKLVMEKHMNCEHLTKSNGILVLNIASEYLEIIKNIDQIKKMCTVFHTVSQ